MKFFNFLFLIILLTFLSIEVKSSAIVQEDTSQKPPVIMGYYSQWAVYSPNIHVQDLPVNLMTHLVYKSADLTVDGVVEPGDSFADMEHLYPSADREEEFLGSFGQLIRVKNANKKLKTIISIGGWGRSDNFSTLASSQQGREKIARNAIAFMQKYHFDGIEIDWQFPINRKRHQDTISKRDNDPQHLNLLLQEINHQCQQKAINCSLQAILAPYSLDDAWNAQMLNDNVDLLVVDVTRLPGDEGKIAEPQSSLYADDNKRSINTVVNTLTHFGIDKRKIVLSIASFAVGIEGVSNINNGLGQPSTNLSWGSWDSNQSGATGIYNQKNLSYFLSSEHYQRLWDDKSKTSYLYNPSKYGGHFIAYENDRSISAKVDYAEKHQLAGIAIRQLHNGDQPVITVFKEYHWLKSRYFMLKEFWRENENALIVLIQMLSIILVSIITFIVLLNKRNRQIFIEKQTFNRLQHLLHGIEQPLLHLVSVAEKVQERKLLTTSNTKALTGLSSKVLAPISHLLVETNLKSGVENQFNEVISLQQMMLNIKTIFSLNKNRTITFKPISNTEIITNETRFYQLLYNLCDFIDEHLNEITHVLEFQSIKDSPFLILSFKTDVNFNESATINHARLNSLYHQASSLGFSLTTESNVKGLAVVIPFENVRFTAQTPYQLSFIASQACTEATQKNNRIVKASEPIGEISSNDHEHRSFDLASQSNLFVGITSFNMFATPEKDIYKGLEQASQYFIDLLNQDAKVTINHHDQLVAKLGNQALMSRHEVIVNASDINIEIVTQEELNEQDQQLIQVLVYQTLMVQKSIQALLKEPTILSELYELTSNKDKVKYLKAESGYTGIYSQGKKEPRYISMRLRTVRLYFDESFLLQIHRSYLVNPKKVTKVKQVSKLKYVVVIGAEELPISRTYIAELKGLYPHWFA
ncbi:glycosyl hydrolase family 18 protein [Colwellia sp. 1_MG-2023]|uniref:glycosyl hydrolase family 18 protein n=1 Tax=Colwellia sp. 1_MG-2023 TaxID=3062649 RepID=UPI0026E20134|nr:glycosyl hydrolase family 18 protein [Colwellia sp. 1_MG-2023]MDO6445991.1 glycosyl hydrolase family 18 protein [Colwellia sp. 1_MG-2023]